MKADFIWCTAHCLLPDFDGPFIILDAPFQLVPKVSDIEYYRLYLFSCFAVQF